MQVREAARFGLGSPVGDVSELQASGRPADTSGMGLFSRACKSCGTKPEPRIAERLAGKRGDTAVELTNVPYKACTCGRLVEWAFDPGADLSEQLFWKPSGIPFARGSGDNPTCARCGSPLGASHAVELAAEARIDGFEPIGFRAWLSGYTCPGCGLEQAPAATFVTDTWGVGAEGAEALEDAVRSIGLKI